MLLRCVYKALYYILYRIPFNTSIMKFCSHVVVAKVSEFPSPSKRETYKEKFEETLCVVNPFLPRRFPMDEQNRLALDRVKSTKVLAGQERVKIACKQGEINQTLFVQTYKFGTVLV